MAVGDIAVYREATGTGTYGTTPAKHSWDTTVQEDGIFSLGSGTDVTVSEAGYYLVFQNVALTEAAAQAGRSKVLSYLDVNGVEQNFGQGAGFINRDTSATSGGSWSGTILKLSASDVVSVKSWHSDTNTSDAPVETAGISGFQLVRLPGDWPLLRLFRNTDEVTSSSEWSDLRWSTRLTDTSTNTTQSFSWLSFNPPEITLREVGKYLVFATVRCSTSSADRVKPEMRFMLGGAAVPGSYADEHMTGQEGCTDGVLVRAMVVDNTTKNAKFKVQTRHNNTGAGVFTPVANKTAIALIKIPDWAETIRVEDDSGGQTFAFAADLSFDETLELDESDEDAYSFTPPSASITLDETADYLMLGSIYAARASGATTDAARLAPKVNTARAWGSGYGYSRGAHAAGDELSIQAQFGAIVAGVATDVAAARVGPVIGMSSGSFGTVAARSVLDIIQLDSLFGAPKLVPTPAAFVFEAPAGVQGFQTIAPDAAEVRFEPASDYTLGHIVFFEHNLATVALEAPAPTLDTKDHRHPPAAVVALTAPVAGGEAGFGAPPAAGVALVATPFTDPLDPDDGGNILQLGDTVGNLQYSPDDVASPINVPWPMMDATFDGVPQGWKIFTNPWDAIQCPGPDQDPESELYVPYADPADAYIEVRPRSGVPGEGEVVFLQGPYAAGGVNPITGTGFWLDGTTPWAGIAHQDSIGDRYGFAGNFVAFAEAIYWAGNLEADAFRDAENRIIVRVSGDLAGQADRVFVQVGGPGSQSSATQAWWTEENKKADINDTPRRIKDLWIVGANTPLGSLGADARTAGYPDRSGAVVIADDSGEFATSGWGVDEITFQGLKCINNDPFGDRVFGGAGNVDLSGGDDVDPSTGFESRSGVLRLFDCEVRGDPSINGGWPDVFGNPTGMKFGVRFFHSRAMYHFHNVHFGPSTEHSVYVDYINDGLTANLPWWHQYRSYFKRITQEHVGKTLFQLVSRANELKPDPGGDPNERADPGASGLVVFEQCHGEGLTGNPSMITIVNHRPEGRGFAEDGTILIRDCSLTETSTYNGAVQKTGPPLVIWQNADPNKGVSYDENGFGTTRVVIDGFKTFNESGGRDLNFVQDHLFEINGCGDIQIWNFHDSSKWSVGNAVRQIFGFDVFANSPTLTANAFHQRNWNSNNPPVDTNLYGASTQSCGLDRCAGSYNPLCGPVRFFSNASDLPNGSLAQSPAWGAGAKVRVYRILDNNFVEPNDTQLDSLRFNVPTAVPGLGIGAAGTPGSGDVTGTPALFTSDVLVNKTSKYLVQNFVSGTTGGYIIKPDWDQGDWFGIQAQHPNANANRIVQLRVTANSAETPPAASVTFFPPVPKLDHEETFAASAAAVSLDAPLAKFEQSDLYSFLTGANYPEWRYFSFCLSKDHFWGSRSYQFRNPATNQFEPPHESKGGTTVPLDANFHPDFSQFASLGKSGFFATSAIQLRTNGQAPEGEWSIRWTDAGTIDFAQTAARGTITDSGPNFIKRQMDTSAGDVYIDVTSGPVDNVQVFPPGMDPDDDPTPGKVMMPAQVTRLQELCSVGGPIRASALSGVRYCGQGTYGSDSDGTPSLNGWLPPQDGSWPHKPLSWPRGFEDPDQSFGGTWMEGIVQFCNEINRPLHWTVPHEYDDGQILQACEYIRDFLAPNLSLVLEFSNELWNPGDTPYFFLLDKYELPPTSSANGEPFRDAAAAEIKRAFDQAELAFAGQRHRLITYCAGWVGNAEYLGGLLQRLRDSGNRVDAAGPACYVNLNQEILAGDFDSTTTAQELLDALIANIPETESLWAAHRQVVDDHEFLQGTPCLLYYYEGGQSIVPDVDPNFPPFVPPNWFDAYLEAQVDPGMGDFYRLHQEALERTGCDIVCWFAGIDPIIDTFGAWGLLTDLYRHVTGDGQSPKWDATVRLAGSNPNTRTPTSAGVTFDAVGATTDAPLNPPAAVVALSAPLALPTTFGAGPAEVSLTAPDADSTQGGGKLAAVAMVSFDAVSPSRAGNTVSAVATGLSYALPEQTATHPNSTLAVFRRDDVSFSGDRPILIYTHSGAFATTAEKDLIWEADFLEWDWLERGGVLISPSVSGLAQGGAFDGIGTSLWNAINSDFIPEKDAVMIVKWAKTFGQDFGGDVGFVAWGGTSSGGWIGATCLREQLDFPSTSSAQALASTELSAFIWFAPVVWLDALTHTFPGFHWPSTDGTLAATIGDMFKFTRDDVSVDSWVRRDDARVGTIPVFAASSETALSIDISRIDGQAGAGEESDPALQNALDWTIALHPAWHLAILSQSLQARGDETVHSSATSVFAADSNLGGVPVSWSGLITERFAGGVLGQEIRERASAWLFTIYSQPSPPPAVFTLEAPQASYKPMPLATPAAVSLAAPEARHQIGDTDIPAEAAVASFGAPEIEGLGFSAESAGVTLGAKRPTLVTGVTFRDADSAGATLRAVPVTTSETLFFDFAIDVQVGGFVRAQVKSE